MLNLSMSDSKKAKERKSWPLRETLPFIDGRDKKELCFTIEDNIWQCYTHFNSQWFAMKLEYCGDVNCIQHNLRIGISEKDGGKEIISFNPKKVSVSEFEVNRLILLSKLASLMKSNDALELFVEVQKEDKKPKTETHMKKFQLDYKELLLSGKNSDLTINVKRKKFEAHKLILGARSPVFSAMMEHEMKEKHSGEVTIQDIEPNIFQAFLLYLYTGSDEHLDWEDVIELYKLGDRYGVEDLKTLCVKQMTENISVENFFEIFLLSQQHCDLQLSESTIKFFTKNSKKIVEAKNWITFLKRYSDEANILIKTLVEDK